jgi:tRNA G37 N-methylase Trm5
MGVLQRLLRNNCAAAVLLAAALTGPAAGQKTDFSKSLAPYVPSPQPVVEKMLEAAAIKPDQVVYDLGCGDGRVLITAAKKFQARGVGVELSPAIAKEASENIKKNGLEQRVKIVQGNALEVDVSEADVVTLYLLTQSNEMLRPNLERQLKPGARVVSHDFEVRGWKPSRVEKIHAHNRQHTIYVYEMPPAK